MKKKSSPRQSWFQKYKEQIHLYQTENLRKEVTFDETDEKFVPPSVLNADGSPNLSLLFKYELQPADRRYLLRKIENAREEFRGCVLAEILRKKEEERRKAEEAEDEKEIRAVKLRFKNIQDKLKEKAKETSTFQEMTAKKEVQDLIELEQKKKEESYKKLFDLQRKEQERLSKIPDFPTTFSVCKRLHATPPRRNNSKHSTTRSEDDHEVSSPTDLVEIHYKVSKETGALEMTASA